QRRDQVHERCGRQHARAHQRSSRPRLGAAGAGGTRGAPAPLRFSALRSTATLLADFLRSVGTLDKANQGGFSKMVRYRIGLLALVAACAPLAWVLPASAQRNSAKVTTINVTAGKPAEFRFTLSKKTAPSGI